MTIELGQRVNQQMQMEAAARSAEFNVAMAIYSNLVAGMTIGQANPDGFREAANYARTAAPYLLEAFGLVKVELRQTQTDSEEATSPIQLPPE